MRLNISTRLTALSAFLILLLVIMTLFAWRSILGAKNEQLALAQSFTTMERAVDTGRLAQVIFKTQIQEWKNVLIRGGDQAQYTKYKTAFKEKGALVQELLVDLEQTLNGIDVTTPLIKEAADALQELNEKYLAALKQYESGQIGDLQSIDGVVKGMDRAPTQQVDEIVNFIRDRSAEQKEQREQVMISNFRHSIQLLSSLALVGPISGGLVTWRLIIGVTRPLREAVGIAQIVAIVEMDSVTQQNASLVEEAAVATDSMQNQAANLRNLVGMFKITEGKEVASHKHGPDDETLQLY